MATGILLMTFGSATTAAGVRDYLASVYHGRPVPEELIAEFERRYQIVGRSPLIDITWAQASALQERLDREEGPGRYLVEAGMLHSEPRIAGAIDALVEEGADHIVGIVLAPQFSPIILAGYQRALNAASAARSRPVPIHLAGAWYDGSAFIESLASRVRAGLQPVPAGDA